MTEKKFKIMIILIVVIVLVGLVLWGPIMSQVEQAKYKVIESYGNIEVRDYPAMIIAEVEVSGNRDESINQGFKIIADYIFGNNIIQKEVENKSEVPQKFSEKIAMTAPVMQQNYKKSWKIRFVMPSSYTLQTLPKPNNPKVILKKVENKKYITIKFSGLASEETLKENLSILNNFIKSHNLRVLSSEVYAFFNPPWTLPPLRRNEIMIEIKN